MVGGYALLYDDIFNLGDNNLLTKYDSAEAVTERLLTLSRIGKPILVKFKLPTGAVLCIWFELVDANDSKLIFKSSAYTMTYSVATGILRLALTA